MSGPPERQYVLDCSYQRNSCPLKAVLPVVRCGFTSSSTKEATTCLDNDSNDSAPAADEEVDTRSPSLEVEIPVPWQSIELSAVATRLLVTLRCLTFVDLGVVELLMVAVASVPTHVPV